MSAEVTKPAALVPRAVGARTGRYADLGDHRGHVLMGAADTGGAFVLFEMEVDPNGGTPPHIRHREEETFYVQSGSFTFQIGEQAITAGPGDCVFAPRDVAHAFRCVSPEGGRVLILITPGANFEAFAGAMAEEKITPLDPACLPRLFALAERHGITMLPPPPPGG